MPVVMEIKWTRVSVRNIFLSVARRNYLIWNWATPILSNWTQVYRLKFIGYRTFSKGPRRKGVERVPDIDFVQKRLKTTFPCIREKFKISRIIYFTKHFPIFILLTLYERSYDLNCGLKVNSTLIRNVLSFRGPIDSEKLKFVLPRKFTSFQKNFRNLSPK